MTLNELADTLSDMYQNAPHGDSVAMIHLFGIKYALEIKALGFLRVKRLPKLPT